MSLWLLLSFLSSPARAATANFDFSGRLYTKWLYRNNGSQGVLTLGNPFWLENVSGENGVATEFDLTIQGRVSQFVQAGVRIASRFGTLWTDFWENGNLRSSSPNTSGESLGLDHAEYLKLRAYWVRLALPVPTVNWVHVGSTDLAMFNPWTIGKIRFIDRDNTKGVFVEGSTKSKKFAYHLGAIALPKLWVGPNWSTGLGEPPDVTEIVSPFTAQDWAFAGKFTIEPAEKLRIIAVASVTRDFEVDINDPDATGTKNPSGSKDYAVDLRTRYANPVFTAEVQWDALDALALNFFAGYSMSRLTTSLAANGVQRNQGVYPLIYGDTGAPAFRVRAEIDDPFGVGLSFKLEYFNIGQDWNSIFGARREADVLLTDGFVAGGQLPTLNLANEFVDFDEPWFESCIGWHGGTAISEFNAGKLTLGAEATLITYNQNAQNRDVDATYPTFFRSEGFTDTDLYDYANISDRGRDPRSVYKRNQDRLTHIAVLKGGYTWGLGRGLQTDFKVKFINDVDNRAKSVTVDDYVGNLILARTDISYPFTDRLRGTLGYEFNYWNEKNRSAIVENTTYATYKTVKHKWFAGLRYRFGGADFKYVIEYLHKDQARRDVDDTTDLLAPQKWRVVRSKATLEVAW
ncbi:MAG: hypothetical protein HYY84_20205 [Deltaproteobacteria bacterium]|nr:hypothetical protein [Deltaproteobacteria bacterium]